MKETLLIGIMLMLAILVIVGGRSYEADQKFRNETIKKFQEDGKVDLPDIPE